MDLIASDLMWSFFASALESYRKDSVLKPFPRDYVRSDGEKDFDSLSSVYKLCPALHVVNTSHRGKDTQLIKLMRWVLNPKNFSLKQLSSEKFQEIYRCVGGAECDTTNVPKPNYVFEVVHAPSQEEKFKNLQKNSGLLYAFHGSKVENFYSILNYGLRNNLNKVSLYGEGIYLSSDMSIAVNYSPMGRGWRHSMLGNTLSCVAVCEMIDHPDVKCTLKCKRDSEDCSTQSKEGPLDGNVRRKSTTGLSSSDNSCTTTKRSRIKGSEGGEIPEKYFVVRNDDLIRVKYLLVYSPLSKRKSGSSQGPNFFRRHKFFITMFTYVLILVIASICNSKAFKEWLRS